MVRKTAKGLGTYDVIYTRMNELHHFSRKEPAFSCLVAEGYDGFSVLSKLLDAYRSVKTLAFLKGIYHRFLIKFQSLDGNIRKSSCL